MQTRLTFIDILLLLIVFVLSLLISPYYTESDQFVYRKIYEGMRGLSLTDGFFFYTQSINSEEFVHFFLSWIASNLAIDKDWFIAVSNTFLAFSVVMLLRKWNVSIFIIATILLTNFYFYVLYFSAERLKFGFIFLIFSFLYTNRFYIFSFLSIISHTQNLILYGAILFKTFVIKIYKSFVSGRFNLTFIFFTVLILILLENLLLGHILSKFEYYHSEHDFTEIVKILLFFTLSLYYSKSKIDVIFIFIPLFGAVFLIGGDRVNMMGYFVFLYYALPIRNGANFGVLATSAYFLFASLQFAINVIEHGDGFYGN